MPMPFTLRATLLLTWISCLLLSSAPAAAVAQDEGAELQAIRSMSSVLLEGMILRGRERVDLRVSDVLGERANLLAL